MALRQIILGDKLTKAQERMAAFIAEQEEMSKRRSALQIREDELIAARDEVNEDTSKEDRDLLDGKIGEWETDDKALSEEERKNTEAIEALQKEIDGYQRELEEINARGAAKPGKRAEDVKREESTIMSINTRRLWFGMDHQERDAFIAQAPVKEFIGQIRSMIGNKRAAGGAELTVPTVVVPLLRTVILEKSKLLKYVNVQRVSGDIRQPVLATPGEAVWTEMCATSNEMELGFNLVEIDGYMVSAFIPLCNAAKDDSDIDLATVAFEAIGHGIAIAIDKAILFGTGVKMPLGILTRLEQTAKPSGYPEYAPDWKNLSETNIIAVTGKTDLALYKAIIEAAGAAKSQYSAGGLFWAVNGKTRLKLLANALGVNAAGAVVGGVNGVMPLIGGDLVEIDDVPDDVLIGGYGMLYTVGERQEATFALSEHVRFLQNQTVFRGNARYDGKPAIAEGFVAIGINGNTPSAAGVTFAADSAN